MMFRKAYQSKKRSLSQFPFGNLVSLIQFLYFLQNRLRHQPIIQNSGQLEIEAKHLKIIRDILYHSRVLFIFKNKKFRFRSPLREFMKVFKTSESSIQEKLVQSLVFMKAQNMA